MAPEKIQYGWSNTIINPYKGQNQCTGDDKLFVEKDNLCNKCINNFKVTEWNNPGKSCNIKTCNDLGFYKEKSIRSLSS